MVSVCRKHEESWFYYHFVYTFSSPLRLSLQSVLNTYCREAKELFSNKVSKINKSS